MKTRIYICALAFLCVLSCQYFCRAESVIGNDARVSAKVDRSLVTIGDKINYRVELVSGRDVEVEFNDFGDKIAGLSVKGRSTSKHGFLWGRRRVVESLVLETYAPGRYVIPKFSLRYRYPGEKEWRSLSVNDVVVTVATLLDKDSDKADIRDIRPPVALPSKLRSLILAVVILLAIGVVAAGRRIFGARMRRRSFASSSLPAHQRAYLQLEELKRRDYPSRGLTVQYYRELSLIVRVYLEERFKARAPEMTTEEFLLKLKDSDIFTYDQKRLLRDFLSHCDLVKFAQYGPTSSEVESSFESARNFIDQTKEECVENKDGK